MTVMTRSICPVCGRDFPHAEGLTVITCGNHDCLVEAIRRLEKYDELCKSIAAEVEIADNMRDYWKHQADGED